MIRIDRPHLGMRPEKSGAGNRRGRRPETALQHTCLPHNVPTHGVSELRMSQMRNYTQCPEGYNSDHICYELIFRFLLKFVRFRISDLKDCVSVRSRSFGVRPPLARGPRGVKADCEGDDDQWAEQLKEGRERERGREKGERRSTRRRGGESFRPFFPSVCPPSPLCKVQTNQQTAPPLLFGDMNAFHTVSKMFPDFLQPLHKFVMGPLCGCHICMPPSSL